LGKPGRPTAYQPKVAEKILDEVATDRSLRDVCADPGFPDERTIRRLHSRHEEFRVGMERARQLGADLLPDDIDQLLDSIPDEIRKAAKQGVNESAVVQGIRTMLDGKKWLLSKISPRYADRIATEVSGPGGAPFIPETDPLRLSMALHHILNAAAKREGMTVDHVDTPKPGREFDTMSGQPRRLLPEPVAPAPEPQPGSAEVMLAQMYRAPQRRRLSSIASGETSSRFKPTQRRRGGYETSCCCRCTVGSPGNAPAAGGRAAARVPKSRMGAQVSRLRRGRRAGTTGQPAHDEAVAVLGLAEKEWELAGAVSRLVSDPRVQLAASDRGIDWYLAHPQAAKQKLLDMGASGRLDPALDDALTVAFEYEQYIADDGGALADAPAEPAERQQRS
jgi:hypothetical protein